MIVSRRVTKLWASVKGIRLALTGHIHRNEEESIGATPTLRLTTRNAGRPLDDDPGRFRVITIEGVRV